MKDLKDPSSGFQVRSSSHISATDPNPKPTGYAVAGREREESRFQIRSGLRIGTGKFPENKNLGFAVRVTEGTETSRRGIKPFGFAILSGDARV